MARSNKNDSDIDSDYQDELDELDDIDYDKPLPLTNEDTFNNIFRGATTLPPRIRNKPQRHCASPTPPLTSKKKNTKKKKAKKTTAPLVTSNRTNQNDNSQTKKRTRKSSSIGNSSTTPSITSPALNPPLTLLPNGALLS